MLDNLFSNRYFQRWLYSTLQKDLGLFELAATKPFLVVNIKLQTSIQEDRHEIRYIDLRPRTEWLAIKESFLQNSVLFTGFVHK